MKTRVLSIGRLAVAAALVGCLWAQSMAVGWAARPRQEEPAALVLVDAAGGLLLLAGNEVRPITPPVVRAEILAGLRVGEPSGARLSGMPGVKGELVMSPTGSLWWVDSRVRYEVQPQVADDVVLSLPVGEPLDLGDAEARLRAAAGATGEATAQATAGVPAQPGVTATPSPSTTAPPTSTPSSAAEPTPARASSAIAEALTAARNRIDAWKFDEAIALLTPHSGAGNAEVLVALGDASRGRGSVADLRTSLDWYTKAIALNPDVPRFYRVRAMAYDALGPSFRVQAIDEYQKAIDTALRMGRNPAPGDYTRMATLLRVVAYAGDGFDPQRLQQAADAATKALGLDNDFIPAYTERARIYAAQRVGGSDRDVARALAVDPGSTVPHIIAWHAIADTWGPSYAADRAQKAGQYWNDSVTYWDKYIALIESDISKIAERDENWEAKQITPDWAYYYRAGARAGANPRDKDRVLADYAKAIQLNPREPSFYAQRGFYYYNTVRANAEAKQDFLKYLELLGDVDDEDKGRIAVLIRRINN